MPTITISRQLGSQGSTLAKAVGERLGYRVVWRDLINLAAQRAGAPEVALAAIDELGLFGLRPSAAAFRAYHQAVAQVLSEMADAGEVIIVGRAGQVILRDHPNVIHVRVIAPAEVRAQRLAARCRIPIEAARAQVETSDRARRNYLRRYYHARWDDPTLYDLIINTARVPIPAAADLLCSLAAQWEHPFA